MRFYREFDDEGRGDEEDTSLYLVITWKGNSFDPSLEGVAVAPEGVAISGNVSSTQERIAKFYDYSYSRQKGFMYTVGSDGRHQALPLGHSMDDLPGAVMDHDTAIIKCSWRSSDYGIELDSAATSMDKLTSAQSRLYMKLKRMYDRDKGFIMEVVPSGRSDYLPLSLMD